MGDVRNDQMKSVVDTQIVSAKMCCCNKGRDELGIVGWLASLLSAVTYNYAEPSGSM